MLLREIAELVGGYVVGNAQVLINGVAGIEDAKEDEITYLSSPKHIALLLKTRAVAFLVSKEIEPKAIEPKAIELEGKSQVIVKNPLLAFGKLLDVFHNKPYVPKGIMEGAYVEEDVSLGKDVTIYPNVYICAGASIADRTIIHPGVYVGSNTKIGADCIIYPNVTVRENVSIGNKVIIHANSVIGADGFKYEFDGSAHIKIPHVGTVEVADNVEIGAGVTIDRATTGKTVIGYGTKIDNLVQIAHNVKIGAHTIIVAQTGIAGSSEVGDGVILAGQTGVADHTKIESGTIVGAQSGVMGNVAKGVYFGSPAVHHIKHKRALAYFYRLPELSKKIEELEGRLNELKDKKPDSL
ncbi:MAG: UDP-3-O-(3-hydroxymyristoyl)glucosamine N-acyltransferase [Candidatus Magnetoovum sp. WYHC-5]|nr:UDP-3-O-(3-hydroxymyristoyl)glucosamine N-acyltransferase [Candidatus Magnetoovum sp. WYHC-5]